MVLRIRKIISIFLTPILLAGFMVALPPEPAIAYDDTDTAGLASSVEQLLASLDTASLFPNPLVSTEVSGTTASVYVENVTYTPPSVSLTSIDGGFHLSETIQNLVIDLRISAEGSPLLSFDLEGTLNASALTIETDLMIQVTPEGSATADTANMDVAISDIDISFEGDSLSVVVLNIVDFVINAIQDQLTGEVASEAGPAISDLISGNLYSESPAVPDTPGVSDTTLTAEWIAFMNELANWQADMFLQSLDIIEDGFDEAEAYIAGLGSSIDLPDMDEERTAMQGLLAAVIAAGDDEQGREAMKNLLDYVKNYNAEGSACADTVKQQMESLKETLSAGIRAQIEAELSSLKEAALAEIKSLGDSYRQSLLAEIGAPPH
ncbi:hypothetical protein ACFLW0_04500 [Chloroflexota bacterium]